MAEFDPNADRSSVTIRNERTKKSQGCTAYGAKPQQVIELLREFGPSRGITIYSRPRRRTRRRSAA
jgi:hypothetical protein